VTGDLEALVDKGRRSLVASGRDVEAGDYDFAVFRAYYAMFHLAVAALKTRGGEYRRHAAVIAAFRDQFVVAGVFAPEIHAALARAFTERSVGDYQYERRVTRETARRILHDARRFVDQVESYLRCRPGA
jgi:uncharacterized protein (UPF0332 family)